MFKHYDSSESDQRWNIESQELDKISAHSLPLYLGCLKQEAGHALIVYIKGNPNSLRRLHCTALP